MALALEAPEVYEPPNRPILVYDQYVSWEENVERGPLWPNDEKYFPPYSSETPYKLLGQAVNTPLIIAAGPAYGRKTVEFYLRMGWNVTHKTTRTKSRPSNPAPNIAAIVADGRPVTKEIMHYRWVGSMDPRHFTLYTGGTNSFGNPSWQIERWQQELAEANQTVKEGQFLSCSITATPPDPSENSPYSLRDYAIQDTIKGARAIKEAGVSIVEINDACPNVTEDHAQGEMFKDPEMVAGQVDGIKEGDPDMIVGLKVGLFDSKDQARRVLTTAGNLDFVSAINAVGLEVTDVRGNDILPGRRKSGVCGWPIRELGFETVEMLAVIREQEGLKFELIGGGGIVDVRDVDMYRSLGADGVAVAYYAMRDPLFRYRYELYKKGLYRPDGN